MDVKVYLIGSLRNPKVPEIAGKLREHGVDVFDDWYAAGPEADDKWRDYERGRGHSYLEALDGFAADHVFSFDKRHLDSSDAAVLVLPAGKSGHLELGYVIGRGKPAFILLDDPERWDVMYKFADKVFEEVDELVAEVTKLKTQPVYFYDINGNCLHGLPNTPTVDLNGDCYMCGEGMVL